jgi:hypothetical protein
MPRGSGKSGTVPATADNTGKAPPPENPIAAKSGEVPSIRCSFCNKPQEELRRLFAGPCQVYICDECVVLCREIVDEENAKEVASLEENLAYLDGVRSALLAVEEMRQLAATNAAFLSPQLITQIDRENYYIDQKLRIHYTAMRDPSEGAGTDN